MFANLTKTDKTIAANIQVQLDTYKAPGEAVVRVFVRETAGLSRDQITANAADIQAAMVVEIAKQGPENVSRHLWNPAKRTVVDVAASAFSGKNALLFVADVKANSTDLLDEGKTNKCYHVELAL